MHAEQRFLFRGTAGLSVIILLFPLTNWEQFICKTIKYSVMKLHLVEYPEPSVKFLSCLTRPLTRLRPLENLFDPPKMQRSPAKESTLCVWAKGVSLITRFCADRR